MHKTHRFKKILCGLAIILAVFQSIGDARTFFGRTVRLPLQTISPGSGKIFINFKLPANHEFANEAPSTVFVRTKDFLIFKTKQTKPSPLNLEKLPYSLAYTAHPGQTVVVADFRVHFCDEVSKICLSDFIRVKFPVQVKDGGPNSLSLSIPLKSKRSA